MFQLPKELEEKIFDYDSIYKDFYDKVINEIKKFGMFISYDDNSECYFFLITKYKGIYTYRCESTNNYKKALKNTLKSSF